MAITIKNDIPNANNIIAIHAEAFRPLSKSSMTTDPLENTKTTNIMTEKTTTNTFI